MWIGKSGAQVRQTTPSIFSCEARFVTRFDFSSSKPIFSYLILKNYLIESNWDDSARRISNMELAYFELELTRFSWVIQLCEIRFNPAHNIFFGLSSGMCQMTTISIFWTKELPKKSTGTSVPIFNRWNTKLCQKQDLYAIPCLSPLLSWRSRGEKYFERKWDGYKKGHWSISRVI